jgi:hypothetical protein
MSKPNTDGGWLLPAVIDPPSRLGVCVPVPNEPAHRQAFLGALLELARWWNWQRDPLKRGREAAEVWMTIWREVVEQLQEGEGCGVGMFDVRQNEDAPCILEKSDDGDTWVQFANLALCRAAQPPIISGGQIFVQYEGELIPVSELPPSVDTVTTSDERRPEGDDADEARCLAAVNAAYVFRRLHDEAWKIVPFAQQTAGDELLAGILTLVNLGVLAPAAIPLAAASALIAYLFIANSTQFTSTVEREFACILKNRSYISNGEVYFDFSLVKADVVARIVGINIWTFINGYLDVIGANGLNLAGTTNAITECCDPCNNGVSSFIINLALPENQNILVPVQTFSSTWTWINGTGWRLQGVGGTGQGSIRATLPIKPNCEIVNVFFRFTTSHEPYNWSLNVNGVVRTQNGYRPFGNFYHGMTNPLNRFTSNLNSLFFLHVSQAQNSQATFNELRIDYRGCPPL